MKQKHLFSLLMLLAAILVSCDKNTDNPGGDGKVIWTSELAIPINPSLGNNYMPAVDESNNIYVLMRNFESGLWGGYAMQKFDKNGNEQWVRQSTDDDYTPHNQMPLFYNNKLYFTTDKKVVCLNAGTGNSSWEYNIPDSMLYFTPAIAIVNNQLLITLENFTAEYSYLFALDPASGDVNGTLGINTDRVWLNMAARGNSVYLAYGNLYRVTVGSDGYLHLDWSVELPGGNPTYYYCFQNDMVISANGNITFAYSEGGNAQTDRLISYGSGGARLWEYERPYASRITLDGDGNVYDGGIDNLLKINGTSGQKVWETEPPSETMGFGNTFTSMVHAANGVMYCGDMYGIYGVDLSGAVQYSLFPDKVAGSSVPLTDITMLDNGDIIVMSMGADGGNGNIHCIRAETGGIATTGWPKRGGNAANTFNVGGTDDLSLR